MVLAQKTQADTELESALKFYSKMSPARIIELNDKVNRFLISNSLQIKFGSQADLGVPDKQFVRNVMEVQRELGFKKQDGKWGTDTQKAYDKYDPNKKEELREIAEARVAQIFKVLPTRADIQKRFPLDKDAKPVKVKKEEWISGYSLAVGSETYSIDIITDKPPSSMTNKEKAYAFIRAVNDDRVIFSNTKRHLVERERDALRRALTGEGELVQNSNQIYSRKQA